MSDSMTLFKLLATSHVKNLGVLVARKRGSDDLRLAASESALQVGEKYLMTLGSDAAIPYSNEQGAVEGFVVQLSRMKLNIDAVEFWPQAGNGRAGVTWRHLVSRMDALRAVLLGDRTIMDRIFQEAETWR